MKCANCNKREGSDVYVGNSGMMGYVHGFYQIWCKKCIYEAQIEFLENELKRIPRDLKIIKKKLGSFKD